MSAVDIHGHVTSPELFKRLPMPPSLADIDGMIEQKAAAGIGMTIVGSPVGAGTMVPVPGLDNWEQPAAELDAFHEWIAETVREHPDALRGYVYTNPLDEELVERAARRLEQDEFVGLIVNTSIRGEYLNTPRADAFFALAAERQVPVLLHPPAEPIGTPGLGHAGLVEHIARPCDITVGVAALVMAGWLDTYPGLRLIVSGGGAALPLLVEKLEMAQRRGASWRPGPPAAADRSAADALRSLYVDTATPGPLALEAALRTWGPDRMLFGTDSPPLTEPHAAGRRPRGAGGRRGEALGPTARERRRVLGDNARELFGLRVKMEEMA